MSQDFFSHLQKAQAAIKAVEIRPTAQELARAPEIDLWLPVLHHLGAPCLWGQVRDHPFLGGDDIITSREGAEVIPPPPQDEAHRIGAALHAEMPWMSAASTLIMRDTLLAQKRKEFGFVVGPSS